MTKDAADGGELRVTERCAPQRPDLQHAEQGVVVVQRRPEDGPFLWLLPLPAPAQETRQRRGAVGRFGVARGRDAAAAARRVE
jgi:hypothetical protein